MEAGEVKYCRPTFVTGRIPLSKSSLVFVFPMPSLSLIHISRVPNWDTMLHTLNGFLVAAIGFSLVDILNRDERAKFNLSPLYMACLLYTSVRQFGPYPAWA